MSRLNNSVLHKKSLAFGVRIIKFYKYLCDEKREYVLSKQILRSGTSIGANARECRNAQSNADFINKLSLSLKEADETQYWLELFLLSEIITQEEYDSLNDDVSELIAILTKSIKTVKTRTLKDSPQVSIKGLKVLAALNHDAIVSGTAGMTEEEIENEITAVHAEED